MRTLRASRCSCSYVLPTGQFRGRQGSSGRNCGKLASVRRCLRLYQNLACGPLWIGHAHTLFEGAVRVRGVARAGCQRVAVSPAFSFFEVVGGFGGAWGAKRRPAMTSSGGVRRQSSRTCSHFHYRRGRYDVAGRAVCSILHSWAGEMASGEGRREKITQRRRVNGDSQRRRAR